VGLCWETVLIQRDLFSLDVQSRLVDMFVSATKAVVTNINFVCTALWLMKLMVFTSANLSPTELADGNNVFTSRKSLIFLLCMLGI
jgi:hypothetical protein